MLLKEIIYLIRTKLKENFDDSKVTDDYLATLLNNKRAYYIRREYNQIQRSIDNDVKQTFVLELEEVEAEDCDCGIADLILRTKEPIPDTIELHNQNLITRVASPDQLARPFSLVSHERAVYSGTNTYTSKYIFSFLHSNGHLYVFKRNQDNEYKSLEFVSITGVFDNPLDINFTDPISNAKYFDYEKDNYPIKQWMIEFVVKEVVEELAGLKQLPPDNVNNATDDNG